ncbi:MAG: RnfABCDGE type electron transport complex subunit D [Clostridia bacterium]|nr:RnfABCDGE type electron transport complex subunit D [Clostridia bacterium]
MSKYIVSSSPHISSKSTTQKLMLDVIIALVPTVIASVVLYGFYPLFLLILSVGTAVFSEWAFNTITKRPNSTRDLSAIVTGMIFALCLPPVVPFYVAIVGAAFAIIIVKMLFGGIGRNFANPAVTARIFVMLCWAGVMTKFVAPIDLSDGANLFSYFTHAVNINLPDAITTATPLAVIKGATGNPVEGLSALDMFLGRIGGSAGEVSTLAVLIGGLYLTIRRVIDVRIPLLYIGSTVVFTAIFYANTDFVGEYVWSGLLGGGLVFGAFFMATDYATSPKSTVAVIIYGVLLGFITVIIRKFGSYPEGVSFAILIMNIVTPLLEKIKPRVFGQPKKDFVLIIKNKQAEREAKKALKAAEGGAANE